MCPACTNVSVRDLGNYRYPVEKIGECPTQYGKKDPRFAARLMLMVLREVELHEISSLPVDKYKAHGCDIELCMKQYYRLFRSYRYPGKEQDCLHTFESFSKHIIVACKNKFYSVDLSSNNVTEEYLVDVLNRIHAESLKKKETVGIGVLTTEKRRRWARIRNSLIKDLKNRESMGLIERSLCLVCLDDPLPLNFNQDQTDLKTRSNTNMVLQMLHGGGSKFQGCNRWYDKTVQFIVSSDGVCGMCYEHSAAEGIAVIEIMDRIMKGINSFKSPESRRSSFKDKILATNQELKPKFKELEWTSDNEDLKIQIRQSSANLDKAVNGLEYVVFSFDGFGKQFIRSCNISPDSFIQLALQLTFFKIHMKLVATYESASIRRFENGRVDVIRSATKEALDWVKIMCQPNNDTIEDKIALFKKAMDKQTTQMKKVISGHGIDNHLLALSQLATLEGIPIPDLFTDSTYKTFLNFRLSTSQVTATVLPVLGYGPVVPDGYGAAYNIQPEHIIFNISASPESRRSSFKDKILATNQELKPKFKELEWTSDNEDLKIQIRQSSANLDKAVNGLEYVVFSFDGFGKQFIRSCNISPDSFIQLALQLTFFKIHMKLVATYESASIRRFENGRVDVIRSATKEALDWVKIMCQPNNDTVSKKKNKLWRGGNFQQFNEIRDRSESCFLIKSDLFHPSSDATEDKVKLTLRLEYCCMDSTFGVNLTLIEDKIALFKKAMDKQTTQMKKVIKQSLKNCTRTYTVIFKELNQLQKWSKTKADMGIDNHLLALSQLATLEGIPIPDLFTDSTYKTFLNFRLSTSQVTATVLPVLGYGPVVPDGYGAAYNIQPEHIIFNISAV
ncbi:Choline O-acetyltransferase [Nymphon striatum]|nr:Choline O-acetyltransferase [Nymphon striatum]